MFFFDLASAMASMEDDLSISKALMKLLKTAAASMLNDTVDSTAAASSECGMGWITRIRM